ncbi:hypothetical protein T08_2820 [Trichinella sp. T8]|nr:hypothetical protein T08_2820 [Trichinella sp. T8]
MGMDKNMLFMPVVVLRRQISKKRVEADDMHGNKDQSECLEFELRQTPNRGSRSSLPAQFKRYRRREPRSASGDQPA